jgi:hypothetical protein
MQWTFPVAGPLRADLELTSGGIEVGLAPTDEARVLLEPMGPMNDRALEQINEATVTCENGYLVVSVPRRRRREVPLRLAVLIPPKSAVGCNTASADVAFAGEAGPVGVRTASGDVTLDGPCDSLEATTASGDVRVPDVLGEARIRTASGDVVANFVGGHVAVDTASGDLTIQQASHDARFRTASGDVKIMHASQGDVSVHSASGDVTIGVAQGIGTWLDVTTVSGTTRCSLQSENSVESQADLRITVRTVSGDVSIRPADPPAEASRRWGWAG